MKNIKLLIVLLFASLSSPAFSQTPAIQSITGGTEFAIFNGGSTGDVVGYQFTVSSSISVTDLGVWNQDVASGMGGLDSDHMVGIWDETQTLIASGTVTPAGTVVGDWTYASITPVTLDPGQTYVAGAMYSATDDDGYISSPTVMSEPEVAVGNAVFPSTGDLGFVFPTEVSAGNMGRYGPNFIFGPPPPPPPIPTLSQWGIMILALSFAIMGIVAVRRRKVQVV